MHIIKAH